MPAYPQNYTDRQLKDFFHGERLFGANNNRLIPKYSFLYHVSFVINPFNEKTMYTQTSDALKEVGMLAKSVELPKFDIETKELNAYNQRVNVQTGIKYQPVKIEFHDDSANVVRHFWEDYMTYYYNDSNNAVSTAEAMSANRYAVPISNFWGYLPRDPVAYLVAVKIFSLSQQKYSLYTLVNPIIDAWSHGTHVAGQNEFLGHSMSLRYEYVQYESGFIQNSKDDESEVPGFGEIHYDKIYSTLTRSGYIDGSEEFPSGKDSRLNALQRYADPFEDDPYKTYGALPRGPRTSTLFSRLEDRIKRAGQSVIDTSISKAQGRLRNIKIGNSTVNNILQPALQNTISQGAAGLDNAIFPSPYKQQRDRL